MKTFTIFMTIAGVFAVGVASAPTVYVYNDEPTNQYDEHVKDENDWVVYKIDSHQQQNNKHPEWPETNAVFKGEERERKIADPAFKYW
ncbi:hypothetical protein PVAR5_4875 [Paecilomyces variotii No. 5]|uniref:Uncharacterized protein n=1 Tax=Byssochlamys spectabilis (strain No. 5 / NBRC 109023) TaxID=1356009 RepID=V5I0X8_BYSSN|nr:hypothetical protein PVAR5_4875 [Paecilomyces variotii No. 5]